MLSQCESDLIIDASIFKPPPEISASFDIYLGPIDGTIITWNRSQFYERDAKIVPSCGELTQEVYDVSDGTEKPLLESVFSFEQQALGQ